jgi:hypothetical protein
MVDMNKVIDQLNKDTNKLVDKIKALGEKHYYYMLCVWPVEQPDNSIGTISMNFYVHNKEDLDIAKKAVNGLLDVAHKNDIQMVEKAN